MKAYTYKANSVGQLANWLAKCQLVGSGAFDLVAISNLTVLDENDKPKKIWLVTYLSDHERIILV